MKSDRTTVLKRLREMATAISKEYSGETERAMCRLCSDWNSEHHDEEIFMADDWDDEGRYRFFIEDDYFYPAE